LDNKSKTETYLICYHCGDECPDNSISIDEKFFCCNGCKTVFEILDENNLCNYYNLDDAPGISPDFLKTKKFDYLDDQKTIRKLVDFSEGGFLKITFDIPQIHCSSCIWLLENLYKLNSGIISSQVDFLKKELTVSINNKKISLKESVQLLASIGYEPKILLDSLDKKSKNNIASTLYYRVGIAGFCFVNIMMLSFPEYLGIDLSNSLLIKVFNYLNLLLALPVFFYSAWEYFGSALKGLNKKIINIDFPISLGISVLFIRSVYEVLSLTGAGYFDSLTGLVFFLLIGKLFQEKTYGAMNFERNYKSFFPLSVTIRKSGNEKSIPVSQLMVGNRILVRQNEIIPADSILFNGNGKIDYSFVTGESKPIEKVSGEMIYAGGRQIGGALELEIINEVSQSYLTQLWTNDIFNNPDKSGEGEFTHFSNTVSKYFTAFILLVAAISALFWLPSSTGKAINVLTAVLIIACPCALALSIPFTLGNTLRIFGKNKFYLKNIAAIENMGRVDTIVFDKTGTLTKPGKSDIIFNGKILTHSEQRMVKSLARNSVHPLSKKIYSSVEGNELYPVTNFMETTGMGLEGMVFGHIVKIGLKNFVSADGGIHKELFLQKNEKTFSTKVYLSVDEKLLGYFELSNSYRNGIDLLLEDIDRKYDLSLLSGDNEGEKDNLLKLFKNESQLFFNQSPEDKLNYIKKLQTGGRNVLMIGDGLNDAGALKQSDVGIAVTEDTGSFSPASDAILDADKFNLLPKFINFSKTSVYIIFISFTISLLYNVIGLSFAVQGFLSPIVAAILMPLSSISVVVFATLSTHIIARRRGLLSQ
jgi:Cu+-exporting ATPase